MIIRTKKPHTNTIAFEKPYGKRMTEIGSYAVPTANGTLKVDASNYPRITLNIVYKSIIGNISKMKPNILKIKKEIIEVLENNGFKFQKER